VFSLRYWHDDFHCLEEWKRGSVLLEYFLDACPYFYKGCAHTARTPIADAWRLARCTPACLVLCRLGADGGYVVVEEGAGRVWAVYVTEDGQSGEKAVHIAYAKKRDKRRLNEMLQEVATASPKVRLVWVDDYRVEVVREL